MAGEKIRTRVLYLREVSFDLLLRAKTHKGRSTSFFDDTDSGSAVKAEPDDFLRTVKLDYFAPGDFGA